MPSEFWLVIAYAVCVAIKVLLPEHPHHKLVQLAVAEAGLLERLIHLPEENLSRVDAPHWRMDPEQIKPIAPEQIVKLSNFASGEILLQAGCPLNAKALPSKFYAKDVEVYG